MSDLFSLDEKYKVYKEVWIENHITDEIMDATREQYENCDYGGAIAGMYFDEYVENYGFADGSIWSSFDEFVEEDLPVMREEYAKIVANALDAAFYCAKTSDNPEYPYELVDKSDTSKNNVALYFTDIGDIITNDYICDEMKKHGVDINHHQFSDACVFTDVDCVIEQTIAKEKQQRNNINRE